MVKPPNSVAELLQRAEQLAGCTLGELAVLGKVNVPHNLLRAKGFVGQLLETLLGTTAKNAPEPDFKELGVELKTIPIDQRHYPRESTYVCTVPMLSVDLKWEESVVFKKLAQVLWIPVEANPQLPLAQRRIGSPLLWSPCASFWQILQRDWEELMELVSCGYAPKISAQQGTYLQIRPKAAHGRIKGAGIDEEGKLIATLPLGFYLRTRCTAKILQRHYNFY